MRPAGIGREAKPMIWPYFRTGSPAAMSPERHLVPQRDRLADLDRHGPPSLSDEPLGIGRAATATLSSPRSRTALGGSVAVAILRAPGRKYLGMSIEA